MGVTRNNFGLLRLIFASMVIVGHEPEFIDANRHHEPMTMLFHTVSLGETAVLGFFLISGYLITKSAFTAPSRAQYVSNRLRRILPGYVVAYLLCTFVLAPFVGGDPWGYLPKIIGKFLFIQPPPFFPGLLSTIAYGNLDSSMWTIAYELRCYLIVLLMFSFMKQRRTVLILTASLIIAYVAKLYFDPKEVVDAFGGKALSWLAGSPTEDMRLFSAFFAGSCFYLYWPEINELLTARVALTASGLLAGMLFVPLLAQPAIIVFGSVALFWLAQKADLGPFQRINDRWDISYGVYLYGWPAGMTLLYFNRNMSAWVLTPATLLVAMALGTLSWYAVEKPLRRARVRVSAPASEPIRQAA